MTSYITIRRHAEAGRTLPSTQYNEIDYLRIRKLLKMDGDIDIGANKIKTTNLLIKEETADLLVIRDRDDTTYKGLDLYELVVENEIKYATTSGSFKTKASSVAYIEFKSHNGSAYVTNLRLIGGYVEIYNGKLVSDLNANLKNITFVNVLSGGGESGWMGIDGERKAANAGLAIAIRTRNSADEFTERLLFYGGYDIANILIRNAQLKPDVASGGALGIEYYVDDYGGNFANFTPPEGFEGRIIVAIDTNSTNPGQRLYVYANGKWNYVDLTVA